MLIAKMKWRGKQRDMGNSDQSKINENVGDLEKKI